MREMESIAFVIPGVLKRGEKLKERRWEKSFNNDIIERIWCWGILRARKRVFFMRIRESWLSFWCMCYHALCVLEGEPTARQPAGSLILLFRGGKFKDSTDCLWRHFHLGILVSFFELLSDVLYLAAWMSLPLGDSRSAHSPRYRSRNSLPKGRSGS